MKLLLRKLNYISIDSRRMLGITHLNFVEIFEEILNLLNYIIIIIIIIIIAISGPILL